MKIAICTPSRGSVSFLHSQSFFSLGIATRGVSFALIGSDASPVSVARNDCIDAVANIEENLQDKSSAIDYVFFFDGDILCPPDTLNRLIAHNKDIVGAGYTRRGPPYDLMVWGTDGKYISHDAKGLQPVGMMPIGCCLIRREIFKQFTKPIFRFLSDETRGVTIGEDTVFIRGAIEKGFQPFVDMDLTREVFHADGKSVHGHDAGAQEEVVIDPSVALLRETVRPAVILNGHG